jgi:hypothetical protein
MPITSLYSFDLKPEGEGLVLSKPAYLSGFVSKSYVNQPHFINDSEVLISCDHDRDGFTDILMLNIKNNSFSVFCETKDISEFSPTINLGRDYVLTTRIEDDKKTQTVWKYPLNKSNKGTNFLPKVENPGYFAELNSSQIAVFQVFEPNRLSIWNTEAISLVTIDNNIGRCLKVNSTGQLIYTAKVNGKGVLKRYKPTSKSTEVLGDFDGQDFELLDDETIVSGKGTILSYMRFSSKPEWIIFADLSMLGIKDITRLAYRNGKLLIVNAN